MEIERKRQELELAECTFQPIINFDYQSDFDRTAQSPDGIYAIKEPQEIVHYKQFVSRLQKGWK